MSLTRRQLDEMDATNAERMVPLNCKDRGTPFEPIGPSQPVKRGATWEGASEFILRSEERNKMSASRKFFRVPTDEELRQMTPWQRGFYESDKIVGLDINGKIKVADMSPWISFATVLVSQEWLDRNAEWLDWRDEYLATAVERVKSC